MPAPKDVFAKNFRIGTAISKKHIRRNNPGDQTAATAKTYEINFDPVVGAKTFTVKGFMMLNAVTADALAVIKLRRVMFFFSVLSPICKEC